MSVSPSPSPSPIYVRYCVRTYLVYNKLFALFRLYMVSKVFVGEREGKKASIAVQPKKGQCQGQYEWYIGPYHIPF